MNPSNWSSTRPVIKKKAASKLPKEVMEESEEEEEGKSGKGMKSKKGLEFKFDFVQKMALSEDDIFRVKEN